MVIVLGITVILVIVSFGMLATMFIRNEPLLGAIGVGVLLVASVLGAWYGVVAA